MHKCLVEIWRQTTTHLPWTTCCITTSILVIWYLYSESHYVANDLRFVPIPEHLAVLESEVLASEELKNGVFWCDGALSHKTGIVHFQQEDKHRCTGHQQQRQPIWREKNKCMVYKIKHDNNNTWFFYSRVGALKSQSMHLNHMLCHLFTQHQVLSPHSAIWAVQIYDI